MGTIAQAVGIGMVVLLAGTLPRNLLFAANLRFLPAVPWAVPLTALYIWAFWRFLNGDPERRADLRACPIPARLWAWALLAGGLGIVALVLLLRLANRLVELPAQQLPDRSGVPAITIVPLLILAAPVAGIIEEAAFRGYMQGPIERRYGLALAILISGTMFGVAHLDFRLILWPYYVLVAVIYGTVTYLTQSILPAIVLHTGGNLYSNFDLWRHGQAEWQAGATPARLIWDTGPDRAFLQLSGALVAVTVLALLAYTGLARQRRKEI